MKKINIVRQKMPVLIIGVLIGIIIMQLKMPVAESQSPYVETESLYIVDESGKATILLFNGTNGPILGIGDVDKPHITMGAPTGAGTGSALIVVNHGDKKVSVGVGTDANIFIDVESSGGLTVSHAENEGDRVSMFILSRGGYISTMDDWKVTGELPGEPISVGKPVTWGQIKRGDDVYPNYSSKPTMQDNDIANAALQMEMEYRRKLESLR